MTEILDRSEAVLDDAARSLLFTDARTANSFADEPVSDETLQAIWELAKWPPTAANTNPLRILFLRTPEAKARIVPLMNDMNQAKTASAPVVAVLAVDTEFHEYIPQLFPARPEMKDNFADPAVRESVAEFNGGLQIGYFLLAVRAEGLHAGPMAGFDKAAVDAEFFGDTTWKSQLVVNIGKPGENPWWPRLPRLDYEQAVSLL